MNRLKTLADLGQSIWIDYIRRDLILSGGLERLVRDQVPAVTQLGRAARTLLPQHPFESLYPLGNVIKLRFRANCAGAVSARALFPQHFRPFTESCLCSAHGGKSSS